MNRNRRLTWLAASRGPIRSSAAAAARARSSAARKWPGSVAGGVATCVLRAVATVAIPVASLCAPTLFA